MSEPLNSSQNSISNLLAARGDRVPASWRRLGTAVWESTDTTVTHIECLSGLPEYIEAEVAGELVAQLYPNIKHHLDWCETCASEYLDLLEVALAEQRHALPKLETTVAPDLVFLTQAQPKHTATPAVTLNELVLQWARALIERLDPEHLLELAAIAPPFFQQARAVRESVEPYQVNLLGMGAGTNASSTLSTLTACYAATHELVDEVSQAEFETWRAQNRLTEQVKTRAKAAALATGQDAKAAETFSNAYAEQVASETQELLGLLKAE